MMTSEMEQTASDFPNWADPRAVASYLERNLPGMVWNVDDVGPFFVELRGSYSCDDGVIDSHVRILPGEFSVWTTVRLGPSRRLGIWPSSSDFDGAPTRLINYVRGSLRLAAEDAGYRPWPLKRPPPTRQSRTRYRYKRV